MTDWLSPAAAGALLGVGPDRVAQLARDGSLHTMRTPGGHLRVDRADVERLATNAGPPREQPAQAEPEDDVASEPQEQPTRPVHRKSWEDIPRWRQRVREAQADVEILGLDDKKDLIQEAREERKAARERAEADRQLQAGEDARLRQLKTQAMVYVGYDIPAEIRAEVVHEIERLVTSDRYPRGVSRVNAAFMLKADVDRLLAPHRARQAEAARAAREPKLRELAILTALLHAMQQLPADWDTSVRKAFERDCRQAVTAAYKPGIDQQELNDAAQDVIDQWLDEDEDEFDDDELDKDDDDEDDYEEDEDGDDW